MNNFINQKITTANTIALIKVGLLGVLSAESWYFSKIIASKINIYVASSGYEFSALIISLLLLFLVIIYLIARDFYLTITKIIRSKRIDVAIMFFTGILISASFSGIGSNIYTKIVASLTTQQLLILILLPIVLAFLLFARAIILRIYKKDSEIPFFLSDIEQKSKDDDLLDFSEGAERFAERVYNQGSPDSMVFGIDAPWGIGKSTFINLCKEYWNTKYNKEIIIYSFNPLRYENRENLLEKFVDGLIRVINKNVFTPEIRPIISKYSRFIGSKKVTFPFFGLNFEISPGNYTVDDAFDDLESTLSTFNRKVIIVVDDLDRLDFHTIKDILFVIKKSFTLPNISYAICYDTDNISLLEKEQIRTEKITEFLEKFVNVKVSLYLDNQVLIKYVSENLAKVLTGNSQADPVLISKAVGGLIDIYKSKDYHQYLPFVGDVRKLKRLINTMSLFELEKTDFENSDFDKQDLIHLLLIYINYPNIFRKIYNTETHGKRGFFSVQLPYDDDYPKSGKSIEHEYKNSEAYKKYIEHLSENQQFLLNKVFDVSKRLSQIKIDNTPQEIASSYACFNGGWTDNRNLEEYLNLIVRLSKPQKRSQHKFYLNCKNEVLQGKPVKEILEREEFSDTNNELSHELFWRVITNSLSEFNSQVGSNLIIYLLNNITNHSFFSNKDIGVGLRDDLVFFLIKLLDQVGWSDSNGKHYNNTEEYISEITEWVFGEKRHKDEGVISTLGMEERGVLGLYDLLVFRLYCSADRGGHEFNLQRALSKHSDPKAPTDGLLNNIAIVEIRKISQKIFQLFENQYINANKNIFDLIDRLTLPELTGKYISFVEAKVASGEVKDIDKRVAELKTRMKSFITYQLGNSMIKSGIGCGYYDQIGAQDKNGIKAKINNYLFDQCFNPVENLNNYEHFVDYLLINFANIFSPQDDRKYIPHIDEFTKVLDKEKLFEYWKNNSVAIRNLNLELKSKVVFTANYNASYKDDVINVYNELDKMMLEDKSETNA
ncbi:MAG: P-loop ATPase [Candidatus Schekmanbacteria bacterium]|nr:P-loop ATPase [Candidatus Schekmanbacteria bacterium]